MASMAEALTAFFEPSITVVRRKRHPTYFVADRVRDALWLRQCTGRQSFPVEQYDQVLAKVSGAGLSLTSIDETEPASGE